MPERVRDARSAQERAVAADRQQKFGLTDVAGVGQAEHGPVRLHTARPSCRVVPQSPRRGRAVSTACGRSGFRYSAIALIATSAAAFSRRPARRARARRAPHRRGRGRRGATGKEFDVARRAAQRRGCRHRRPAARARAAPRAPRAGPPCGPQCRAPHRRFRAGARGRLRIAASQGVMIRAGILAGTPPGLGRGPIVRSEITIASMTIRSKPLGETRRRPRADKFVIPQLSGDDP